MIRKSTYFRQMLKDKAGVALIEFAIVLPVLLLLLFGSVEFNRLILIQQKHEKAGYAIADIITQYKTATTAEAGGEINETLLKQNIFPQFTRIMSPYGDEERQAIIVSSIEKTALGSKIIRWQITGGGTLSGCDALPKPTCVQSVVNGRDPSSISPAVAGTAASFPTEINNAMDAFDVSDSINIIVVELFYRYQPALQDILQSQGPAGGHEFTGFHYFLQPQIFVKRTYFLPREGELYALPPTFPVL